jgi:purine-nucleoside phosphorylase
MAEAARECIEKAAAVIRGWWDGPVQAAAILGTGLGRLADELAQARVLPYAAIPHFPRPTALAHRGRLVLGRLDGTRVLMLQGRCHLYEGYSLAEVTFPVRVLAGLGIEMLVVTNAAGGLNPQLTAGDVLLIEDHLQLMGLRGTVDTAWVAAGGRVGRPSGGCYDAVLGELARQAARRHGFDLPRGVYVAVTGPSYETRAEYRAFRRIGGDCVGMSTVPEVLVAVSCGMRVLGLSTITNVARPDAPARVDAGEVVSVAEVALPRVRAILSDVLRAATGSGADRVADVGGGLTSAAQRP